MDPPFACMHIEPATIRFDFKTTALETETTCFAVLKFLKNTGITRRPRNDSRQRLTHNVIQSFYCINLQTFFKIVKSSYVIMPIYLLKIIFKRFFLISLFYSNVFISPLIMQFYFSLFLLKNICRPFFNSLLNSFFVLINSSTRFSET